ncbi:hypothetical protein [Cellulomonas soli]|uniref:Uncharacterized protein n=1 Tax=Cellulomonas soli TaxID=931535 RepID=A0A512PFN2_9CELL|nr:hypothetical protein [Cellulomonas soli]NYI59846.1 hypothetical protein [Cellulomonas soli]GEP70010.1 hypothetical protein CSO01_27250 [Cellulomonas soli]
MSGHEHDEHGHDPHEHGGASHGPAPLDGVDGTELHAVVDALAQALHGYVETALGVRAEFGASESDEDPRILAIEAEVGTLNARLYDLLHERLGLHADLTGMAWDGEEAVDEDAPPEVVELDSFHLGFLVGPPTGTSDLSLDSVLGLVDDAGAQVAQSLAEAGFEVVEWTAARGAPVPFDEDEDDEEDTP